MRLKPRISRTTVATDVRGNPGVSLLLGVRSTPAPSLQIRFFCGPASRELGRDTARVGNYGLSRSVRKFLRHKQMLVRTFVFASSCTSNHIGDIVDIEGSPSHPHCNL